MIQSLVCHCLGSVSDKILVLQCTMIVLTARAVIFTFFFANTTTCISTTKSKSTT